MTPLVGWIAAIAVGLVAPSGRAAVIGVIGPMLAAVAVQTWGLASGRGHNPPSTVHDVSYWVVQVMIFAIFVGIGYGVYALRARWAARRGSQLDWANLSGPRGPRALAAAVIVAFVLTFGFGLLTWPTHLGTGNGNPPVWGVLGIALGLVALVGLGTALLVTRRQASPTEVVG